MGNEDVLQGGIEAIQSVSAKVKIYREIKGGFTMFQKLKKRIKNEKGLSLVELLAVIVILAIVAAIAIPSIGNIVANSKANAEISDATQILNAVKLYELDGNKIDTGVTNTTTGLENYVEYTKRIKSFTVTKDATSNEYKITFEGEQLGSVPAKSLVELSEIKVEKGKIGGSGTTPDPKDE